MAGPVYVYYRYNPSLAAAVIFIILFIFPTFLHLYRLIRTHTWFFIPLVIGGFFEWVGYVSRALSCHQNPNWTSGPYIVQTILLLLAPALFAASIYMQLGRIILATDGEKYSLIKRTWLTKAFVTGDVLSFGVQAAGGGIMAGGTQTSFKTGENIILVGLALQVIFFGFFTIVAFIFNYRLRRASNLVIMEGGIVYQKQLNALYISSLLILVRSIFRVIEYGQGNDGYLMQHELFMYVFDAVLMVGVMVVFLVVHPGEISAKLRASEMLLRNV